jgi:hypothetical protein
MVGANRAASTVIVSDQSRNAAEADAQAVRQVLEQAPCNELQLHSTSELIALVMKHTRGAALHTSASARSAYR